MKAKEIRKALVGKTLHRTVEDYVITGYLRWENSPNAHIIVRTPDHEEKQFFLPVAQIEQLCKGETIKPSIIASTENYSYFISNKH